jgi:hypothetical protein
MLSRQPTLDSRGILNERNIGFSTLLLNEKMAFKEQSLHLVLVKDHLSPSRTQESSFHNSGLPALRHRDFKRGISNDGELVGGTKDHLLSPAAQESFRSVNDVPEGLFIPDTPGPLQPDYPRARDWLLGAVQVVIKTAMSEICLARNCSVHIPALWPDRCFVEGIQNGRRRYEAPIFIAWKAV